MNIETPTIGGNFTLDEVKLAHIEAVIKQYVTLDEAAAHLKINIATLYRIRKRSNMKMRDQGNFHLRSIDGEGSTPLEVAWRLSESFLTLKQYARTNGYSMFTGRKEITCLQQPRAR